MYTVAAVRTNERHTHPPPAFKLLYMKPYINLISP